MLILADALSAAGTVATIAGAVVAIIATVGSFFLAMREKLVKVEARIEALEGMKKDHTEALKELTSAIHHMDTNFALVTQAINTHLLPVMNTLLNANPSAPIPPVLPFEQHEHRHRQQGH